MPSYKYGVARPVLAFWGGIYILVIQLLVCLFVLAYWPLANLYDWPVPFGFGEFSVVSAFLIIGCLFLVYKLKYISFIGKSFRSIQATICIDANTIEVLGPFIEIKSSLDQALIAKTPTGYRIRIDNHVLAITKKQCSDDMVEFLERRLDP